jgi:arylsulfatase
LQVRPEDQARYDGKVPENAAKFFGMIANIDDNVGRLLAKLKEWGIEEETLVIFMNDNGGTAGLKVFNAGLHSGKGSPWQGGTRAVSFWRWPGTLKPADVTPLTAHIDVFPTLAEIAGAKLDDKLKAQVEGRSLMPLLKNPKADWPDRTLVTHVGRWPKGGAPIKLNKCSVRNSRYSLVHTGKAWELFDLKADPGESKNIAGAHPEVVQQLTADYDKWWNEVQPYLVNEDAWKTAPTVNPFKEQYERQMK